MFENVTILGGSLALSDDCEVTQAELQLGIHFPAGYREYITQFGEGILDGCAVQER